MEGLHSSDCVWRFGNGSRLWNPARILQRRRFRRLRSIEEREALYVARQARGGVSVARLFRGEAFSFDAAKMAASERSGRELHKRSYSR